MAIDIKIGIGHLFHWADHVTSKGTSVKRISAIACFKEWAEQQGIEYRIWIREPTDEEQNDPVWTSKIHKMRNRPFRSGEPYPIRRMRQIVFSNVKHAVLFKLYWSEYL